MPSLDVPRLVPSWVMPAWLSEAPTSPREALRRQRLQTLRSELAAARRVPALPLPPPPGEEALGSTAEDGGVDLTHSASNAVPFTTGAAATCSGSAATGSATAAAPARADAARQVVLAYPPQQRQLAAETLALYLHVYHGVSGQEAAEAAGAATGSSPVQSTLRSYLEELALLADGWFRRVTLAWPYAGGHVEIVGEAVGGWEQRAPMVFDVKRKRWKLQIWGLPPGIHRFKYLVDGCWVIDLAAHTEADARGNINNVVLVTNTGKPLLRGMQGSASDSSDEDDDGPAAAPAAASSPNVLPTAEPPVVVSGDGSAAAGQQEGQEGQEPAEMPRPWSSPEEMETMARFGAAVLAFHTRLGLQLRHVMH
ncbi:hypothetical protein COHA_003748 [Chlorella ohadii]|uniref:AMP-activated protein kinase glycogen-binding domain-containing protein n=1 Tax=Chlorella ohadii TaxID=2649997 RepID=A0AAD5H373_9CHLO|nr:hypothetical protein COHA_003748 [Chlorella ohadii]